MKRTIFYSWQSDLPNNTNWTFIEDSIVLSTKELKKNKPISININVDRATREDTGSPDITESIFSKISNSSVFIADISIVNNSDENIRKTPNPNVLIELGYAARTLGWEKIICIYNTDFGSFDDLPFDLRNRRIMTYSLNDKVKLDIKKGLSSQIKKSIIEMQSKGILTDKILDFLKKEIDQEMLALLSHLIRFINKQSESINFFDEITAFLNYEKEDIIKILKDKKVIGFYILKSFFEHENKFNTFINQAMGSQYYNREILNALIDIYEWFSAYSDMWTKYSSDLFIKLDKKEDKLFVIHSNQVSPDNKLDKRYLLMEKVGEEGKGRVHDFGDFYPGHIENLINYYQFNNDYLDKYVDALMILIRSLNNWLNITNNEIIMDFVKNFRVKKTDGDWL
ncbi:MAG: hypothetical protein A2513_01035 [Sulfurimonas sp. RIFOXYD12_FULL_33_39]|uniref:hypothetical protein n=1 Tax=unclassified Sulfurimonas TaxID=2623549 RepID=UPI0008AB42AD|nr:MULTISPECIES: hypothetical protein [unclassified Sulfurimonas]OHE10905.1 MAG: hypothetical protein A2513_01035 [Sulfurimonas sp. RIFOXYD12_FULL_33_39]OHE13325.1 MAG: hypothetical protein A2530_07145 [Sulfurimonas sp. RIFOXYD2_FULL_34_21]